MLAGVMLENSQLKRDSGTPTTTRRLETFASFNPHAAQSEMLPSGAA